MRQQIGSSDCLYKTALFIIALFSAARAPVRDDLHNLERLKRSIQACIDFKAVAKRYGRCDERNKVSLINYMEGTRSAVCDQYSHIALITRLGKQLK